MKNIFKTLLPFYASTLLCLFLCFNIFLTSISLVTSKNNISEKKYSIETNKNNFNDDGERLLLNALKCLKTQLRLIIH